MNPKVKMIDRLIRDQVKLFPDFPHNDDGLREVITQVVTGKPGRRMAKLYKCLVESFIMVWGSDQSKLVDMVFSHIFFTQAPGMGLPGDWGPNGRNRHLGT